MGCSTRIEATARRALAGLLLAGFLLWLPAPADARFTSGAQATTATASLLQSSKRQARGAKRRAHRRARRDTDRDGLPDRIEIRHTRTHPRRRDTDRDRLSDGVEVKRTHTDPRRRDTDRDGLSDWFELRRAKTNPRRADTDGDGARDRWEFVAGTDPRNPASAPWLVPVLPGPAPPPPPVNPPTPEPDDGGGQTPDPIPPPDTTPPPIQIDSGPKGLTNDPSPTFGFSTEPGATLECSIDDGGPDFGPCSDEGSHTPEEPLADGEYTFAVRATDQTGNPAAATRDFEVDTALPPAPELEATAPPSPADHNTPLISGSAEPGTSVDLYAGPDCDDDPIATVTPAELEVEGVEATVANDSTTAFRATATTPAGNASGCSEALEYVEDSSPPETTIDTAPPSPLNSDEATFEFSGDDGTGSGIASFECKLDDASFATCDSGIDLTGLSEGPHSFEVRAIDNAGNVDADPAKHEWTVDLTAPEPTIDSLFEALVRAGETSELTWHGNENGAFELRAGGADCDSGAVLDSGPYSTQPATETSEVAAAQLAEGANALRLCLTDAAGNRGAATAAIVKDTEAPDTSTDEAPDPLVNSSAATFAFSGSDPDGSGVASFECRLDSEDSEAWEVCTSPREYDELGEGAHAFEVRAIDQAGNVGDPASHEWTVDTVPPTLSIDSGPDGLTNDPSPSFGFDSEPGAAVLCSIDDEVPDFGPCLGADSHGPAEPLADGPHTFRVRATDQAGNEATATRNFEVDTTLPPAPVLEGSDPASPANANDLLVLGSAEAGTTVRLYVGESCEGEPIATVTPAELGAGVQTMVPNDSTTTFRATATTVAENTSGCSEPLTYVEDSTAPETQIDDAPDQLVNADTATFAFTGSDPGGSGVDFECSLDEAGFEVCESGVELTELAEGAHAFEVRAVDQAGNVGDPASHEWTVDTVAPTLSIDSGPDGLTNDPSPSFGFDSEPGATLVCSIDDGAPDFGACSGAESHSPAEPLADGPHTFRVRAIDEAGNTATATRDFEVDTALPPAPVLEGTAPPSPANHNTPLISGTAEPGASVDLYAGSNCEGDPIETVGVAELEAGVGVSVDDDSTTTFRATATTEALNTSGCSEALTYVEDSRAPETQIDSGPEALVDETDAELWFSGSDPDSSGVASFECRLDSDDAEDWAPCTSPRELTELADGGHAFEVRGIDQAGNIDDSPASHEWTVDATAPQVTIESVSPALVGEGGKSQVTWHADENGAFELRVGGADCDTGAVIESGAYGSQPAPSVSQVKEAKLAEGANTLRLCLTDGTGNRGEATATIEKDTGRPDAQIDSSPDAFTQSHTAKFAFSGSDPGGSGVASFECRLDSESWDECTSPREYAGLAEGPHEFEVRAFDNAGNPDLIPASVNWTVDNTPPEVQVDVGPDGLTSNPSPTFGFGSEPGATFECSIDAGIAAFGPCSGAGSHTPAEPLADGPHTFRVRATDQAGNQASAIRSFEVDAGAPPEPILTSTVPASPANENEPRIFGSAQAGSAVRLYTGGTCSGESVAKTLTPTELEGGVLLPVPDNTTTVLRADIETGEGISGCSEPLTYVEDSTAPGTTIASSPPATTYSTSASFFLTVNEPGASTECSLDGAPFAPCASPRSHAGLTPGEHSFAVRATDAAGNLEVAPAELTWTIEPPPTPTSACAAGGAEAATAPAVRSAVQAGEDACITADVGHVDLGDLGSRPVVVSTEGGSMDDVDLGSTTDLTISQARFRSITLRGSHRTHLLANTIGGTPAEREADQLIFMPEANHDVLVEGNDIGWTIADNSGNTGYGCRCYGELDRLRFVGNKVHDIAADGFQGVGGVDVTIDRNEIGPVGRNPGSSEHSDSIQITGNGANLRITNNWIHHQGFYAGEVTANAGSTYIHGGSNRSLLYENNLIETARGRTEICGLGTGGSERSNLTVRRNTWVEGGLAFDGFPGFEWDCDGGSENTITGNIAIDPDGGFADHGYDEAIVAPNLFGDPSTVTLDAEGNCTSPNCNPPGEDPIGYRKPSGVAW